jgi:hypothetical protein
MFDFDDISQEVFFNGEHFGSYAMFNLDPTMDRGMKMAMVEESMIDLPEGPDMDTTQELQF